MLYIPDGVGGAGVDGGGGVTNIKKILKKEVEESDFIRFSLILAYTRSKYCESDFITKLKIT